jgi:hypothetical protein
MVPNFPLSLVLYLSHVYLQHLSRSLIPGAHAVCICVPVTILEPEDKSLKQCVLFLPILINEINKYLLNISSVPNTVIFSVVILINKVENVPCPH